MDEILHRFETVEIYRERNHSRFWRWCRISSIHSLVLFVEFVSVFSVEIPFIYGRQVSLFSA